MSVEGIDESRKLLPWKATDELIGIAIECSKNGTVVMRLTSDLEKEYHRTMSRCPLNTHNHKDLGV